jgi:hypothetical protein
MVINTRKQQRKKAKLSELVRQRHAGQLAPLLNRKRREGQVGQVVEALQGYLLSLNTPKNLVVVNMHSRDKILSS